MRFVDAFRPPPRNIARAIGLLILLTGLPLFKYPLSFVTHIDAYLNPAGLIMVATAIPYMVLIGGSIALLANRQIGYPLVYAGALLSVFGTFWSFIPFLPAAFESPQTKFGVIFIGNLVLLGILFWCQHEERQQNDDR